MGRLDSRAAFLGAWSSACASNAAATILVPSGSYLLTRVVFSGQCKNSVTFQIDGTLVAPTDYGTENWITFDGVSGVTILGGTLDGQGAGLWACKNAGKTCPIGATVGVATVFNIGSLGKDPNEQGVQNVTVKTAVFSGTQNGVRIKTWAKPNQGFVRGVLFEDVTINNAQNPVLIDQEYCPDIN
ncbi:hypothetical protein Scep_029290 [Stephania cephalantha]|uniref:Polygalacturonase n=1 Tax=Stephania cephalantha TaxID=152367 RepID=A0AAP0DXC8_9MAGN